MTPDFQFDYEPRSSKEFPESFTITAKLLGQSIYRTFNKLDGIVKNTSLSSNVLIKNDSSSGISQLESENLVIENFWGRHFLINIF